MWRLSYIRKILFAGAGIVFSVGFMWFLLVGVLQLRLLFNCVLAFLLFKAWRIFGKNEGFR